ncbi:MAG TPA: hypothetical protein VGR26_00055 [Acidimicrobiales bacterium]|nr:hypothetical protein [Acidimicrobiales bacterium]
MALDRFEIDTDGVAAEFGDTDVADHRTRSDVVALAEERGDAGVDDVRRARLRLVERKR